MAVNLSPVGGAAAQFLDNSGNVLTGGKLYTYSAGTTTPAVTYTTNSGLTPHANPIVLNAAGRVADSGEIWLTDGISYKFVLKDANDVQIAVYDNIIGINSNFIAYTTQNETQTATQGQTVFTLVDIQYIPATNNLVVYINGSKQVLTLNYTETSSTVVTFVDGLNVGDVVQFTTASAVSTNVVDASNVAYNLNETGSVNRTVESRLQERASVLDFGAIGDGVADDTDAIQAALDSGRSIYFPNGTYLTNYISVSSDTKIYGESRGGVVLEAYGSIPGNILIAFPSVSNVELCNITIADTAITHPSLAPIHVNSSQNIYIHDVELGTAFTGIQAFSATSCVFEDITIGDTLYYGIYSSGGVSNKFNRITTGSTDSFHCIQDNLGFGNEITNCNVRSSAIFGISIYNSSYDIVTGNFCSETIKEAINLDNSSNCLISNNICYWSAGSEDFGISLFGPAPSSNANFNVVTGNMVTGCGKSGIALAEQCQFNIISNNTITNVNTINETFAAGVLLYGTGSGNNTISNNTVWANNGKLYYGINASGAFGSILTNNFLVAYNTAPILNVDNSALQLSATGYTAYTPTVTAGSGTITSYTATGNYYQIGYMIFFQATVTITNNGSGATSVNIGVPFATSVTGTISGRNTTNGASLQGIISGSSVAVFSSTNTYPAATGSTLYISGFYQRT
jgi:parallel beta-helix repeat protein